jgi:4-hydroxy-tetrahydrodipicolinate reductase
MTKIIVSGAAGKMGRRLVALSKEFADLKLVGALERSGNEYVGKDSGHIAGIGELNVKLTDKLDTIIKGADVILDFSSPEATLAHFETAVANKKAMVIGTTGIAKDKIESIRKRCAEISVVLAPNMSVGVNLLLKTLQDIARVLGDDYDVEIVEAHHRLKKDAPSGTALKMAQVIADALRRNLEETAVYARKGLIGERTKKEIGIQTVRAGDIVGEHTVIFGGLGERVEITHRASSRDTFARGALRAASWVVRQKPGLYDMQDVLGLK